MSIFDSGLYRLCLLPDTFNQSYIDHRLPTIINPILSWHIHSACHLCYCHFWSPIFNGLMWLPKITCCLAASYSWLLQLSYWLLSFAVYTYCTSLSCTVILFICDRIYENSSYSFNPLKKKKMKVWSPPISHKWLLQTNLNLLCGIP